MAEPADTQRDESYCWWAEGLTPAERGARAVKAQRIICDLPQEATRRDLDIFNIRLYENNPVITLYTFAGKYYSEVNTVALPPPEQSVNNKAKSAIDTLASQIFSTDQRARFVVVDGNYRQRRRAREMQNFTDGLVHELGLHELKQRVGLDASILESGAGAIQFYREGDRCAAERVLATELAIDPLDGLVNGMPRSLYRRRPVPRDKVRALFGSGKGEGEKRSEDERKIDEAIARAQNVAAGGAPADHIEVCESWHLPTSKDAKDGWHITALDTVDGVMAAEPYEKPYHEIVFFSLEDKFTTAWGLSLMTQARPLQTRINANTYRIERAQKLFHAGHIYVDRAMKFQKSKASNEIGSVWEGNGPTPPQQILFNAVAAEMYAQVEKDGSRIFENLGISVAASQGETNAGLNASAAAKREDTAKSDKRNSVRQQRWERFHIECVKVALGVVRDIVTKTADGAKRTTAGGYKVASPGKRGLSVVDWKDAAIDEADYVVVARPANPTAITPAGLIAYADQQLAIGAWTPQKYTLFLQDLDRDGRVDRDGAQERGFDKIFEAMLYDKVAAYQPDEFTNYAMALQIGTEYLAQGQEDEVPDKNLDRVRRYLKACKAKQAQVAAASAPPPGAAAPAAAAPPQAAAA